MSRLKSKWSLIIPLAVFIQLFIIYRRLGLVKNTDLESALQRAKTESCKKELLNFVTNLETSRDYIDPFNQYLKRSCPLDDDSRQQIQKVGCMTNASTNNLIRIDEDYHYSLNVSKCLELCFSYSHKYGGFDASQKHCYCGENLMTGKVQTNDCQSDGKLFDWFQLDVGIYNPLSAKQHLPLNETIERNDRKIRIAFLLILNGRAKSHILRLIKNIYSEDHLYYLHVDKRNDYLHDDLLYLERDYNNIILTRHRFNTIWGGTSLLRMILDSMAHLSQYEWDYMINLSESDFPIKPLKELEEYLSINPQSIYLKSHNVKGYTFIKKQGLNRNFYQCEDRVWRLGYRQLPRGIIYSGGSDWFVLPREFCLHILDNLDNPKSLIKPLVQLYNFTLLPVESFFHTIALNDKFCDRYVDNNLRLTNWHRKQGCKCQHNDVVDWCGCSPLIYRKSDLKLLLQTNYSNKLYFSRKFDPTVSLSIINLVEKNLIRGESTSAKLTRDESSFWRNLYRVNNSTSNKSYLHQFGLFAINQVQNSLTDDIDRADLKLHSVYQYFFKDRFEGLIFNYCDKKLICLELLISESSDAHLKVLGENCMKNLDRQLIVIEINHGFDTGERMFREYSPLNQFSDIAVYHEWMVKNQSKSLDVSNNNNTVSHDRFLFSWFNPRGQLELMQNVKLKITSKPTRLSLAHRLNVKKPILPGLWTLSISHHNRNCLNYEFLVFNDETHDRTLVDQERFDKLYTVSELCIDRLKPRENLNSGSPEIDCSRHYWSLFNMNKFNM